MSQPVLAQFPVISSLSHNGELVCTNLFPGTTATVEWASSVLGPWTNNWAGPGAVTVDGAGKIQVSVPMFYRVRGISWPLRMVPIPAGSFAMGSPLTEQGRDSDEGPQTQVTLTNPFWMSQYEVTQGEYQTVMSNNPSYFTGNSNLPVERVTWSNATNYCAKLTLLEQAAGRLPVGYVYRLPTEAEWEYACRAGTTNRFSWGDDPGYTLLGDYAWYGSNSSGGASFVSYPVGLKRPNPWGLHDMNGNVWEWCLDWHTSSLPGGSVTNPVGPGSGVSRILRGGWWSDPSGAICRSASRNGSGGTLNCFGFRVVVAKPIQP